MPRWIFYLLVMNMSLWASTAARADHPLTLLYESSGQLGSFVTGAALAIDGPDGGDNVDILLEQAFATITASDIPADASLLRAYLYWSGTQMEAACNGPTDTSVTFSPPGSGFVDVVADESYCSDGALSYDMWVSRADVTALVTSMVGNYGVGGFDAQIANGASDNASFSVVLLYSSPSSSNRDVALYDGNVRMLSSVETILRGGLNIPNPPRGTATCYVLDGDPPTGDQAIATGMPGGLSHALNDAINPSNNLMNRTINTTTPPQTNVVGVDIDRLSLTPALSQGDNQVELVYTAGTDQWWIVNTLLEVDTTAPASVDFLGGESSTGMPVSSLVIYPNPFRGFTVFHYVLEEVAVVEADVFDVAGRRVVRVENGRRAPGSYRVSWNGKDAKGREVPAGTYVLRVAAAEQSVLRKINVLR